ncbi:MAG: DUF3857 and transglutaminase domain-containing protein [Bacteroidales bacterium]|nr:DUF3857 and transglutaminase domain-containing protein [Bacteroidales bacterium]
MKLRLLLILLWGSLITGLPAQEKTYVTLFDSTRVDMEETGLSHYYLHQKYLIKGPGGIRQFRAIRYGYDPQSAYAEIQKVIIRHPDGTIQQFTKADEVDYTAPGGSILWGAREKMIETGRLSAGDEVEIYRYKKGYTYALLDQNDEKYIPPMRGHFYDIVPFWVSTPTRRKVYQVDIPNDKKVQYKIYHGKGVVTGRTGASPSAKGKTRYTFEAKNLKPGSWEPNMVSVSDVAPKVLLSTAPDWFSKSKWFYQVNEDYGSFESTPEIQDKTNELLIGATDELDSISRLTHWVADYIRYFGLTMGKGEGYTLHKGEMTFRDRCGVCKDKAGMLVTMLRAAGFEAYPAMTMAGSRIEYIPADQFNHSVAAVKMSDGKLHMLDPTWVPFVRELWSSAEQQQNYIIGLPDGEDLQETPVSPPENHYLDIHAVSVIDSLGNLTCHITLTAEGQSDAAFRRMFTGSDKNRWKTNLRHEILQYFPDAHLTDISWGNTDPYDHEAGPIHLSWSFTVTQFATYTDQDILLIPALSRKIFLRGQRQLTMNTGLKTRKYPFRDACSREIKLKEEISFPYPVEVAYAPQPDSVNGSGGSWNMHLTQQGTHLTIEQHALYPKRIYQPDDWPSYRAAVMAQKELAENPVILKIK